MGQYTVQAIDVSKDYVNGAYSTSALRNASVEVTPGEMLAVMGPSGCGKSTLLHLLGGIESPTTGRILLEGAEIGSLTDSERTVIRRRRMGFVFQKMNLLATLSALENVALPLRIDNVSRTVAHERASAALADVNLEARAAHLPHELSGGEQQRVAVARALVTSPAVLFADEPTGALDSENGRQIWQLLRERGRRGQTVVVVTHDAELAKQSDRILRMRDGVILSNAAGA